MKTDTVKGAALVAIISASIGAFFTYVGSSPWRAEPILVVIEPKAVTIDADTVVQFSASVEQGGTAQIDDLEAAWTVGGLPLSASSVSRCTETVGALVISCRFVLPGTFAVSISADSGGQSASTSSVVSVKLNNGYIGISLPGFTAEETEAAYRDLLFGVDWVSIQKHFSRPILIFDPDSNANVYAVSHSVSSDADAWSNSGALEGKKIIIPAASQAAIEAVERELTKLGATLVVLPPEQVSPAVTAGLGEGSFVPVSSPDELPGEGN